MHYEMYFYVYLVRLKCEIIYLPLGELWNINAYVQSY
jgi:hypothetical protein